MDTRKTAAITAAAMAAAGIVTNAAYDAPLDLTEPVPLEETVDTDASEDSGGQPEERQRGALARFRRWADRLPEEVRALVGVPLWWLGAALTEGAALLWTAAASPAAACVVRWLLLLAVAALVFAASVKAALPDVPVGRLLKPRSLAPLLAAGLLLGLADLALTGLDTSFHPWVWHTAAFCAFAAVCGWTVRREKRAALEEARRKAAEPLSGDAVRTAVRELAESVRQPRFHGKVAEPGFAASAAGN